MNDTTNDKWELYELCSRQENAYDSADLTKFMDTWADDGVFSSNAFGEYKGRVALSEWFERFQKVFNGKRHVLSNHEITVNGGTATVYCYLSVFERVGPPALVGTSTFTDKCVRGDDGKWRFVRRDHFLDPGMSAQQSTAEQLDTYHSGEKVASRQAKR